MKKNVTLILAVLLYAGIISAQTDCVQFFPSTEGSTLTTTTYDADDNMLYRMVYRVNSVYGYTSNSSTEIGFTMLDKSNTAISSATINASCMNGVFSFRMDNTGNSPEVIRALTNNTELIGFFLDYPDTFNNDPLSLSPFQMTGGEYTIDDKGNNKKITVRVLNRQYEGSERVITPARHDSFYSSKVSFNFEVTSDQQTTMYKGIEWISPTYGIVRSETYDNNNKLLTRTELTQMSIM